MLRRGAAKKEGSGFLDYLTNWGDDGPNGNPTFLQEGMQCFAIGHPDGGHARFSIGKVEKINTFSFDHTCETRTGSSGCPIFSMDGKLLGVHFFGGRAMKMWRVMDKVADMVNSYLVKWDAAAVEILEKISIDNISGYTLVFTAQDLSLEDASSKFKIENGR